MASEETFSRLSFFFYKKEDKIGVQKNGGKAEATLSCQKRHPLCVVATALPLFVFLVAEFYLYVYFVKNFAFSLFLTAKICQHKMWVIHFFGRSFGHLLPNKCFVGGHLLLFSFILKNIFDSKIFYNFFLIFFKSQPKNLIFYLSWPLLKKN